MISIVFCLALELFTTRLDRFRRYNWADSYARYIKKLYRGSPLWDRAWGIVSVLLLPLLLVAFVQSMLNGVWLGLFELVFSALMLFYCLRFQRLDEDVDAISAALEHGDHDKASQLASKILDTHPDTEQDMVQQVCTALLVNVNERLFAVIVWFALLGPLGALMYRLSWYYSEQSEHTTGGFRLASHQLHAILNWLPARLLVLGYAVVGSFEDTLHGWRQVYNNEPDDMEALNQAIIAGAGCSALHIDRYIQSEPEADVLELEIEAIHAAHDLVFRSMLAWGFVVAVLTVAGWAS
jgi:membrane protein required for beta-lactamase induction